jgi:hypothetical protein
MKSHSNSILSTPFPFSPGILVPILYKRRIVLVALSGQQQADSTHIYTTKGVFEAHFFYSLCISPEIARTRLAGRTLHVCLGPVSYFELLRISSVKHVRAQARG